MFKVFGGVVFTTGKQPIEYKQSKWLNWDILAKNFVFKTTNKILSSLHPHKIESNFLPKNPAHDSILLCYFNHHCSSIKIGEEYSKIYVFSFGS